MEHSLKRSPCYYCHSFLSWQNTRLYTPCKGRFTRYAFVAYDKLTTGLRHELFRVNQTYNLLTTFVYVKNNVVGF